MLPKTPQDFAQKMQELGISDKDHIVVYDSIGVATACRVYWTLKAFGHQQVSVLDGGLGKWIREDKAVKSGPLEAFKVG